MLDSILELYYYYGPSPQGQCAEVESVAVDRSGKIAPSPKILSLPTDRPLKCLSLSQMYAIDEALAAIGPFGEVRLVKNRGRLRFIQTVRSEDVDAEE